MGDNSTNIIALKKLLVSTNTSVAVSTILSNEKIKDRLKQALLGANKDERALSMFRCRKCGYSSHSYAEWLFHTESQNRINCVLGDYKSSNQTEHSNYMGYHKENIKYKCSSCPYMTCTQTLLSEHVRLAHNTAYSLYCDTCGYETNAGREAMTRHASIHGNANSKPRASPNRRRSSRRAQKSEVKNSQQSTQESTPILFVCKPKSEPIEVQKTCDVADNETAESQDKTATGPEEKIATTKVVSADRRPWWDTKTEIIPSSATDVTERIVSAEKLQCASCGNYYTGNTADHQCTVVKPTLTSCTHMCALCDFYTGDKKALMDHYVLQHSRHWSSLVIKASHSYPSLEYLCDAVELLVPRRYKDSADNVWVAHTNGERLALNFSPSNISLFRCTKCFKSFPSLDLQAGHKLLDQCQAVDQPYPFGCFTCGVQFTTSDEGLTHHLQQHTTMNAIKCEESSSTNIATEDALLMVEALQNVGVDNQTAYRSSMVKAKIVDGGYQMCCQLCSFVTDNSEKYSEHLSVQHWEPAETVHQDSASDVHVVQSTLYGCNLCSYVCEDTSSLSNHMNIHAGAARKNTKSKASRTSSGSDESGMKSLPLRGDEQPATGAKAMSQDSQLLLCTVCAFQTTSKSSLRSHTLSHVKNKLQCEQCSFSTTHSSTLTIHMRSHTGYKPFVCSMCGKAFTTNSELRKHERRHAGVIEKKFSCDVCGKTYSTPQHLKVHKRVHTGDRPFKCSLCTFAATSKCVLVNHMATHTGEKNYNCHLCIFTCASSGTLSNHRRLKHNIANKRKTLAETTPESILLAAKIAGKSRRVKPSSNTANNTAPAAEQTLNKETQPMDITIITDPLSQESQPQLNIVELSAHFTAVAGSTLNQSNVVASLITNQQPEMKPSGTSDLSRVDERVPVYQIIQTGSGDYQVLGEIPTVSQEEQSTAN